MRTRGHIARCATCAFDLRDAAARPCVEAALALQRSADRTAVRGYGECLDTAASAETWLASAAFLARLVRRTARAPTHGLERLLETAGCAALRSTGQGAGTSIERLGVEERTAVARRGRTPDATRSRRTPASGGRGRPHPAGMVRARGYRAGAARKGGARAARERSSRVEKHAADAVERTAAAARGEADDEAARALGRDRMGLSPRDGPGKWSRRTATTGARGARATSACTAGSERGWRERCTSGIMECGTGDRPSMNFRSRSGFAADAPPHSKAVEP